MLYFSKVRAALAEVDMEQWQKLQIFQAECQSKGLVYTYETIEELRDLLRSHLGRTIQKLNSGNYEARDSPASPGADEEAEQLRALRSFGAEFGTFLRKSVAAWDAEKNSDPHGTDDGKYVLGRIADELLSYRSRITTDSGQLSTVLSDATKRIKSLQRHQVYLDGGRSFREFWQHGDDILALLEIVPVLLEDATDGGKARERESLVRAAIDELKFNQPHLASIEYGTAPILRTEQLASVLDAKLTLPQRLSSGIRIYLQNVKAAQALHQTTTGGGDSTPELIKVYQLLETARSSGEAAIRDLATFCQYRYGDQVSSAQGESA
jgi:hypothetical protein